MESQTLQRRQSLVTCNWPQLKSHPVQQALRTCPKRFVYVPCGRQSGKTELAMRHLVKALRVKLVNPNTRYFYGGPTYQWLKRTVWRRLLNLIPEYWIEDVSVSELSVRTIFGSEFFLLGLDKPERAEGLMLDGGIIDENSHIKPDTFDRSILPTLNWSKEHNGSRGGWCWFIGVPRRFGVGVVEYKTRYDMAVAGTLPDSAGFTWKSSEIMSATQLDYERSTMDERDYAEQYDASWLSPGGGIFYTFDRECHVRPVSYNPEKPILVGSDFNVDPMCWVFCHLQGDTLLVFDELFIRNTNTPDTLKVMLARYAGHKGGFQMYGDASSRGRHTSAYLSDYNHIVNNLTLQTLGRTMHYLRGNPFVADRFAATNTRICNSAGDMRVYIAPHCTHLINDLEIRSYKQGIRVADDHDDVGHPSDALGYICHKKWPILPKIPGSSIVIIREGR